ncbi:MHFG family PEP-CTERM protein [Roseateles sp. BYS78W]|uniref:MHFG family PEP-CTERM protein n=1 Tax=Pelomonas candidula TaxID=3299025 RepID=A0ABW7HJT2_9BURK
MALLAALALSTALSPAGSCEWHRGGLPAQTGDLGVQVERLKDLPAEHRDRLASKVRALRFDDTVVIARDGITGQQAYEATLLDMKLGNRFCPAVSRSRWAEDDAERALVFCEQGDCVLVTTQGRHLARVKPLATDMVGQAIAELAHKPTGAGAQAVWAPRRVLVGARAGLSAKEVSKIAAVHGGSARRLGPPGVYVFDLPATASEKAVAATLARHPHLKFAELDQLAVPALTPNDPYAGSEWHLNKLGLPTAWDTTQGRGVTIAVLDTGVDGTHPDLAGHLVAGWNFYDNNSNTADVNGHGTAVAGAAAASINNGVGVAGTAGQSFIMPVRIADPNAYAYWSTVAQGLSWASDNGARVANISYGGVSASSTVQASAQYMRSRGGLVVVAAGNNGIDEGYTPTTTMIVVSATDANDVKTSWSSYGSYISIAAPGQDIWTTTLGGGYQTWWGTSLSSPLVAGVVGLMMSARPDMSNTQLESLLYSSSVDLGAPGRDSYYGWGRVNASAAVQAALTTAILDTQAPSASISSPGNGSTVSGLLAVNVGASDNIGVTRVDLKVNGSVFASDTTTPYGFSLDTTQLPNGGATLVAVAYDAAGNAGSSPAVSVTVNNAVAVAPDTTPPVVAISSPANGAVVSGNVTVSVSASDNMGPAGLKLQLLINGSQVASGSGASLSFKWNTTKLAAGSYTLEARATDAAGNQSSSTATVRR